MTGDLKPYVYRGTHQGPDSFDAVGYVRPQKRKPYVPRPRKPLQPCGTRAAYRRHEFNRETPCDPCTEAERAYNAERHIKRKKGER